MNVSLYCPFHEMSTLQDVHCTLCINKNNKCTSGHVAYFQIFLTTSRSCQKSSSLTYQVKKLFFSCSTINELHPSLSYTRWQKSQLFTQCIWKTLLPYLCVKMCSRSYNYTVYQESVRFELIGIAASHTSLNLN